MTIRRIAMQASTANLTSGQPIIADGSGLLASATLLNSSYRLLTTSLPTKILSSYWHASYDEKTVVAGTWNAQADAAQTDFDDSIFATAGIVVNTSHTNSDEIHFGSLIFNPGTYKIIVSNVTTSDSGILELLIGTTSLGTKDLYSAGSVRNVVTSFTYTPTARVSGNLRLKVSGKNGSSSSYYIQTSRIEIIRTG